MAQYAKIEAAQVAERYARGWHCLGLASDFEPLKPVSLKYFGTELVAFRGEDGQVRILDGFCPHMGGHLASGWVKGNSIVCPFHAWNWSGVDGKCNEIPYAKRIPEKACIKPWPTMEQNQLLFVWNDPENRAPIPGQEPPRMDECFSSEWNPWVIQLMRINTNARELVDNMADKAHFAPVHGSAAMKFYNKFHKHVCVQHMEGKSPRLAEDSILTTTATYYGPAYMITAMSGQIQGMQVDSRLLVSHVPVTTESFDLRYGVLVKKNPALDDATNAAIAQEYVKLSQDAFFEDVDIWHKKVRVDNPILCDGDGPVNRLRKWYDQFYVDVADVPSVWDEEKIYETDAINPIPEHRLAG